MMKYHAVLLAVALALALGACGSALAAGGVISGKVAATPAKFLAESVVYVKDAQGEYTARSVKLDQKGMQFLPHVLTVTKGDTVEFENHDSVAHNVFTSDHETYNLGTFKPGETRTYVFADSIGVYTQLCSIHPEMLGFIFVGQNPYSSAVDAQGHFSIAGVPAGSYTISIWNSHLTADDQKITVTDGGTAQISFALHR